MSGAVRYEVVVRGRVGGPVRRALEPAASASLSVQTVLLAHLGPGRDLVDLVRTLREHGISVVAVTAVA